MRTLQQVADLLNDTGRKISPLIQRWRDAYYGISLHTSGAAPKFSKPGGGEVVPPNYFGEEYQQLFDLFLLNRHPRESDITRHWRYSQYRPFTKGPFQQIIEVVTGAIFQDSNYAVQLANKDDNDYIWSNSFAGYDLIHFFEWMCLSIFEDPNGYFVRLPREPFYETKTRYIEPDVWFVGSKDIVEANPDEIIFRRGEFVWLINRQAIFRYREVKRPEGGTRWELFDKNGYYAHTFGYVPADAAGGVWNSQGFYESWLSKAKAAADDFISSKSAEQLVDKEASHPYIIQAQTQCPKCDGVGQVQHECEECPEGIDLIDCGKCKGSGFISTNPGERLEVPPEMMKDDLIKIVNPSVELNKSHREKVAGLYTDMLQALHLLRVEEAQSGVAKAIDQERLYQFISKISNDLFDRLIHNTLRDIIAYRHVAAADGVTRPRVYEFTIIKPTQFQIKTAMDLLAEYNEGTKASVPAFIRAHMMLDFVDKQFSGDAIIKKKSALIVQMDGLCTVSSDEKQTLAMIGAITQRDCQFSARLPEMLDAIARDKGAEWFLKADYEDVRADVDARYAKLTPPIPALQATDDISDDGTDDV